MRAKEHVAAADAPREKMLSPEWRECPEYAGHIYRMHGTEFRKCKVPIADDIGQGIERCASCRIPAKDELIRKLVEALRAVTDRRENEACSLLTTSEGNVCAGCVFQDSCKVRAALAAHDAAEKEVGGDPVHP